MELFGLFALGDALLCCLPIPHLQAGACSHHKTEMLCLRGLLQLSSSSYGTALPHLLRNWYCWTEKRHSHSILVSCHSLWGFLIDQPPANPPKLAHRNSDILKGIPATSIKSCNKAKRFLLITWNLWPIVSQCQENVLLLAWSWQEKIISDCQVGFLEHPTHLVQEQWWGESWLLGIQSCHLPNLLLPLWERVKKTTYRTNLPPI